MAFEREEGYEKMIWFRMRSMGLGNKMDGIEKNRRRRIDIKLRE